MITIAPFLKSNMKEKPSILKRHDSTQDYKYKIYTPNGFYGFGESQKDKFNEEFEKIKSVYKDGRNAKKPSD